MSFTSDRKRMSVLFRDTDGTIKLYMKGADTIVFSRLRGDDPATNDDPNF